MRIFQLGTFLCLLILSGSNARRVRVRPIRPVPEETPEQEQQQFYAQEEQGGAGGAGGEDYNGLYGRSLERAEPEQQFIRPTARPALIAAQATRVTPRVKDTPREPPVQTIRNYSNVNDDGSFTFGYEAADGSFKEETRGTDCVVRGKYGYIDPDGNKREFTYVSGNPCDPNAPQEEEEKEVEEESGEENIPANIPRRPLRPVRPVAPARPATTVFQQSYSAGNDEQDDQVLVQPTPARVQPTPVRLQPTQGVVRVTPRPTPKAPSLPATTYRPQLLVSVTPRPTVFSKQTTLSQPSSTLNALSFDEELKRFQLNNVAPTTAQPPVTPLQSTIKGATQPTGQPVYTSELVYDPSSGQYNTVVYQQLPKTQAEPITFKTRLPQYVTPATPAPIPPNSLLQQQLFQQQKQTLFQQSQDLYNQQRLQQLQSQQHRFQQPPAATKPITAPQTFVPARQAPRPPNPQQFYYFAPQQDIQGQGLSQGQIDAFLRGHNLPPF